MGDKWQSSSSENPRVWCTPFLCSIWLQNLIFYLFLLSVMTLDIVSWKHHVWQLSGAFMVANPLVLLMTQTGWKINANHFLVYANQLNFASDMLVSLCSCLVVWTNLCLKKPQLRWHSGKSGNETRKARVTYLRNLGGSWVMFHYFVHRSFSLSDFVADVQEMIKPVLTAYSKVTLVVLRRNPLVHWTSMIADCTNEMGWLCITPTFSWSTSLKICRL